MSRAPVVYVSGPMTGLPDLGHGALKAMTAKLRAAGLTVICPTETPKPVRADGAEPTHDDWMRASLRRLCDADVIVLLPGWHDADGCRDERGAAMAMGIPRIHAEREAMDVADLARQLGAVMEGRAP